MTMSCSSGDKNAAEDGAAPEVAEAAAESVEAAPESTDTAVAQDPAATTDQTLPADEAVQTEAAQDMNAVDPNQPPTEEAKSEFDSAAPPADTAQNEAPPADAPPADTTAQTETPPPADQNQNDLFGGAATTGDAVAGDAPVDDAPKKPLPITHIKDKPFKKGGQLLNTVYIAREGDTLEGISEKLFAENKVKELKKANPHLKKKITTGAKVYFNSPNRPEDADRMMTVYEDQGLPPTTYTTNEGDTLKALAMEWYGTEASYKEIYAINRNLASPNELPPGSELQYWPASVSIIAYSSKKVEEPVAEAPPVVEPPAPAAEPVPTTPAVAQNSPVPDPMAAGTVANNTLPPPPPDLNTPSLPPPPAALSKKKSSADAMDKDTVMYAVAAGVLLVGGGALVAIRRKNAKRNSGVTQI